MYLKLWKYLLRYIEIFVRNYETNIVKANCLFYNSFYKIVCLKQKNLVSMRKKWHGKPCHFFYAI